MAVPLEQFVKQLENSGILAGDTLKDFLPPKSEPKDAEELARELIRKKKLTKYQAEEVYRGKGKALVLGNYTILDKIGAGGMGQVFKAEHRRMHRIVAVKMLPTGMMANPAVVARFEREVTAAAKLTHPNIVTAFDADNANGVHLLIMEYVEGSDLSALVKKDGPLPVEQALNYILQAARGLEAAHAEGIVHRDIKPANLLLDKKGVVKILDMGLARLSADADSEQQAELTNTGTVMGTIDYMAPEQALNTKTADARADIYSLGCSLYYLLTGKATYSGDTLMAKLLAHRDQSIPSIRDVRPEVPEAVQAVFSTMLAKRIEDRYQTMTEVIADLERLGTRQEQSVDAQSSLGSFADAGLTNFLNEISLAPSTSAKRPKASFDKDWIKKNTRLLLIGAGVLGGLILLAGLVVSLRTKDGTLIVTVSEPDAEVQVLSEAGKIEVTRKGEKGPLSIWVVPGKHQLKVQKDGFELFTNNFEIKSEGKQSITAKLVRLEEEPVVAVKGGASKRWDTPGFQKWIKEVAGMPAEEQVKAVAKKLQELNQGFDGKVTPKVEYGVVTELQFVTDKVTDISPVRALAGLKTLTYTGSAGYSQLTDLSPLKGMPLTHLTVMNAQVSDLLPLKGMPLVSFVCGYTNVSDLSPLKGMPLTNLFCEGTKVSDLIPLKGMQLTGLRMGGTPVADLSPLKGMPLTALGINSTQVFDLSPLEGMPLAGLNMTFTHVTDLSPLKGIPLKHLVCDFKPFRDTEILRSIKSLELISSKPVAEFWKEVEEKQAAFEAWTKQVAEMAAEKQVEAVAKKLQELNPGFDGKVTHKGVWDVTELAFVTDKVTDLSPVRALAKLMSLNCSGSEAGLGKLADLSPLNGMPLTSISCNYTEVSDLSDLKEMPLEVFNCVGTKVSTLTSLTGMKLTSVDCSYTQVSDLSPLKEMPLTALNFTNSPVSDLAPLKGMSLTILHCAYSQVSDLSPLTGMQLTSLQCGITPVSDLAPLKGMPLRYLVCQGTKVADLTPLKDMPLLVLVCGGTPVSDLSPLKGMPLVDFQCNSTPVADLTPIKDSPLKTILCDFKPERDTELLRSIKTLETINQKPVAEFWKEVERQQKGKKP